MLPCVPLLPIPRRQQTFIVRTCPVQAVFPFLCPFSSFLARGQPFILRFTLLRLRRPKPPCPAIQDFRLFSCFLCFLVPCQAFRQNEAVPMQFHVARHAGHAFGVPSVQNTLDRSAVLLRAVVRHPRLAIPRAPLL